MRLPWTRWGLVALAAGAMVAAQARVTWWTETGLVKVLRQDAPGEGRDIRLWAMRGEVEWAQVVFRATTAASVRFATGDLRGPDGACLAARCFSWHPAVYVRTAVSSGNGFPAPEDWPEVLPQSATVGLPAGRNQAVYLQVRVPADTPPGLYRGELGFTVTGEQPVALPVTLTVWPLTLPRRPTMRSSYYIWWEGLAKRYGLADSPRRRDVYDRFFWFLVERRLCPMTLPCDIREAAPYMRDPRVSGVRLPYVGTDAELRATINFVRQRGWLNRCFYYMYDEPPKRLWHEVHAAADRLLSFDRLVPRLGTIQPEPELQGKISLWCPNVESVYLYPERIAEARARGEEVWWYTCAVPLAPYPTYLLDDDAIAPRVLFWMQARYGLTGTLYINTLHWGGEGQDPWREAIASPELRANNDGLLIYTAGEGAAVEPVTGVRLEMIRDGTEDFELLQLLRQAAVAAAQRLALREPEAAADSVVTTLASTVVPDARHCTRNPQRLLARRREAARLTVSLQRDPERLRDLLARRPREVHEPEALVAQDKFLVALPGTPTVDGKLEEAAWEGALQANAPGRRTLVTRFRNLTGRIWPSQPTMVLSLYDQDYLYFAFICREEDVAGLRFAAEEEDLARVDRVAVALSVAGRPKWFVLTADGAQFEGDLHRPQPLRQVSWRGRTHFDTDGYTAEIALPRHFLTDPARPAVNLFRYAAPGDETLHFVGRYASRRSPDQLGLLLLEPPAGE